MLKMFTNHPAEKKKGYLEHLWCALKISTRLVFSSILFFIHAFFPFIEIPYNLNLESMALYLFERNNEFED